MRLVTVGLLDESSVKDLEGQCCVVLVGSPEEVRTAARLLYQDVSLGVFVSMSAPFPESAQAPSPDPGGSDGER